MRTSTFKKIFNSVKLKKEKLKFTHYSHPLPATITSGNHQSVLCIYELFLKFVLFSAFVSLFFTCYI